LKLDILIQKRRPSDLFVNLCEKIELAWVEIGREGEDGDSRERAGRRRKARTQLCCTYNKDIQK
jgi:hypothetical protein